MSAHPVPPLDRRRLIASLDPYTLLGLSKTGEGDDKRMAEAELRIRGTVLTASSTLVDASDRFTQLSRIAALDAEIDRWQQSDRMLRR